ncbi:hypothetical protein V5799_021188 [Amblyomma americanum]|uniref:Uncharacterized protein n=1 Tax=Amblyomma americanum TaxID=6943 RepID=A0AAQ4FR14_AMBAM
MYHVRNPNRAATRQFLQRTAVLAAGVTTAIVVSLIVYFSTSKGLRPPRLQQVAKNMASPASDQCAWESDRISRLLSSTAGYDAACQDFYAFVCNRKREYSPLERSILEKSKRIGHKQRRGSSAHYATETAAILHASCLSFQAASKVSVRKNIKAIPIAVKRRLENALKKLDTPVAILEAQAFLSKEEKLPSYLSFWSDPRAPGTPVLDVRRPLSAFLDDDAIVDALLAAAGALGADNASVKRRVSELVSVDRELKRNWNFSDSAEIVPFETLAGIEAKVTELDWQKFFATASTALPYQPSHVIVRGLANLRQALMALFERMDQIDVAIYSLAHVLLPEEMLDVFARRENQSCLGLVRLAFGNAWCTLTPEPPQAITPGAEQELASIARAVATALKKSIVTSALFTDYDQVAAATTKVNNLHLAAPNATTIPSSMVGVASDSFRKSLDPNNLYKNILAFRRLDDTGFSPRRLSDFGDPKQLFQEGGCGISDAAVTRVALAPPFTCRDRLLNYATLGTVVAEAMLKAVGGLFCVDRRRGDGCPRSNNTLAAYRLDKVKACLAAGLDVFKSPLARSSDEDSQLLEALLVSTAAFQVALEAGRSYSGPTFMSSVSPEMEMRFLTRYCYHLCDRRLGEGALRDSDATLAARLRCNVAVMNSPLFGALFKCSQDRQVFARRCSVL